MVFIIFICLVLIFLLFDAQILSLVIFLITKAKRIPPGPWDLRVTVRRKKTPHIYLMQEPGIESFIVANVFGIYCYISENLWERWSNEERTTLVLWSSACQMLSSNLFRMVAGFKVTTADRNAALEADEPLAVVGVLEKAAIERAQLRAGLFSDFFKGLSLLGPSLLFKWPDVNERLKQLTIHLSKLEKAR